MKKFIAVLCIAMSAVLMFSSCVSDEDESTVETYLVTEEPATDAEGNEITTNEGDTEYFIDEDGKVVRYNEDGETEHVTIVAPSLDEMSPAKTDVTMPYEIEYKLTEIKSLEVIEAEDSIYPDTAADYVYKKDNSQYFQYESGELIVITQKEDGSTYACYYNSDGEIQFCSDDEFSWYFDSEQNIEHIAYTYYNAYSRKNIYTFYSTEGERLYVAVDGIYYDRNLDELTGEEYDKFVIEYADTQELIATE